MMKRHLLLLVSACVPTTGCQTSSLKPTQWVSGLFGGGKSNHTFDQTAGGSSSSVPPSSLAVADDTFRKGESALKSGNWKQAKKHFLEVVQAEPDNSAAHHRLGYICDKQKDYIKAEIHYVTAARLDPKNADIVSDLGYSYMLQGRNRDAKRYLEQALSMNPRHESSLLNLGTLVAQEGDYNSALALFRQAGPEDQAQMNIARFFPDGPPAGNAPQTQMAQNEAAPSELMRDLQHRMANAQKNQNPAQGVSAPHPQGMSGRIPQRTAAELARSNPREIPADRINDVFAQIDAEFEAKRNRQQRIENGANNPNGSPVNPRDLIVRQDAPLSATPVAEGSHTPDNGPWDHQPAPSSVPQGLQDYAVVNLTPPTDQGSTPVNGMPAPGLNNQTNSVAPVDFASQSQPNMSPGINSSPQETARERQHRAMQLALQMGMNAGPGQMFPVQSSPQNSSQTPNGMSPQGMYQSPMANSQSTPYPEPGHQRLNITVPPQSNPSGLDYNSPQGVMPVQAEMPEAMNSNSGVQSGLYQSQPPTNPSGSQSIPDWPYHGQQPVQPTLGQPAAEAQQALPWEQMGQNSPSAAQQPPMQSNPQISSQSSSQEPAQWPYAPGQQTSTTTSNKPRMIDYRASLPQNQPAATEPQLPQIVPNVP